ncbi:MAG: hypothetical protein Q8R48_02530, partial [Candidatus Omnitrophota bacterium]|nr:hypothetical protein [Candidatus Omnitrophota bacterium]
ATVYGWGNWWTSAYEGPMVYSSADGVTWVAESTPGITDTKNYWIDSIEPYKGSLYISTTNFVTGTQVIKGKINRQPILDPIGNKVVNEGEELVFKVTAFDPDWDTLYFYAYGLPLGADFPVTLHILYPDELVAGEATVGFEWTPTYNQAGTYEVQFIVMDGEPSEPHLKAYENITITVNNVNLPPVITINPPQDIFTVDEGQELKFRVSAMDPDTIFGGVAGFTAQNLPIGAELVVWTGFRIPEDQSAIYDFVWTPNYAQAGVYNVVFVAIDSGELPMEKVVQITVNNVNLPPSSVEMLARSFLAGALGVSEGLIDIVESEDATRFGIEGAPVTKLVTLLYEETTYYVKTSHAVYPDAEWEFFAIVEHLDSLVAEVKSREYLAEQLNVDKNLISIVESEDATPDVEGGVYRLVTLFYDGNTYRVKTSHGVYPGAEWGSFSIVEN